MTPIPSIPRGYSTDEQILHTGKCGCTMLSSAGRPEWPSGPEWDNASASQLPEMSLRPATLGTVWTQQMGLLPNGDAALSLTGCHRCVPTWASSPPLLLAAWLEHRP